MKRHSPEFSILRTLNGDETRDDPWNPAPNLLYTAERGDDVVLCFERLFDCDDPPLQTVSNVIDYIRQALEVGKPLVQGETHTPLWPRYVPTSRPHTILTDDGRRRVYVFSTSTTSCIARTATRPA